MNPNDSRACEMKKRVFRKQICIILIIAAAMVLNGCSLRPGPARTPEGRTLFRLGYSGVPESLNPYAACGIEAETVISLIYDTLFSIDPFSQEIVGSLCSEYTVSESSSGIGKLWRLVLRDDVYWSDGEKLTAYDVEFSLQSAKDLSAGYSYPFCEALDTTGISPEDDTHLAMIVWGEEAYVKACLSRIPILPRHVWNELDCMHYDVSGVAADPQRASAEIYGVPPDASVMVGSGLYTWGGYKDGILTLNLNEAYWNGTSKAEVVEFYYGLKDPAASLLSGDIDACAEMSLNSYRVLCDNENVRVTSGTDGTMIQLGFNFSDSRSPVNESAVRQAVEYCTSRDTLLLYAFGGGYSERGFLSPFSRYYSMDEVLFDRPFDVATASSLLENAGWTDTDGDGVRTKNGVSLFLTLICSSETTAWERAAQILKTCFSGAGIGLRIRTITPELYLQALSDDDWDLCLSARETQPEPWLPLACFYWDEGDNVCFVKGRGGRITSLGWNDTGYNSAEFDRIYKQLISAADPDEIKILSAKSEEYLYNDSAAVTVGFTVEYQACSRVWTGVRAFSGEGLYFTPLTVNEQFRTMFTGKR